MPGASTAACAINASCRCPLPLPPATASGSTTAVQQLGLSAEATYSSGRLGRGSQGHVPSNLGAREGQEDLVLQEDLQDPVMGSKEMVNTGLAAS